MPTMEKQFAAVGLTLKKDNDTFKSTYDIMKDLASVWEDLTDMQRADLLLKIWALWWKHHIEITLIQGKS